MKILVDGKEMEVDAVTLVFEDMSPDRESISFTFEESGVSTMLTTVISDANLDPVRTKEEDIEEIYDNLSLEDEGDEDDEVVDEDF